MGITIYSLAISIVFYNLALIAVFILRRSPGFRAKNAVSLLMLVTVLGVIRLVTPIDWPGAYILRSYRLLPAVEDFLNRSLFGSFTYGCLLLGLWVTGCLVMVVMDIRPRMRFERFLQSIDFADRPELLTIASEYGNNFAVLISPQLNMPFTGGILHPTIYLPDADLSDDEWRMVFRHEITHIHSRDNLKKLFFLVIEALFWWNPVAHFSTTEINALIELRCDKKVTEKMGREERLAYTELLRQLIGTASLGKTTASVSYLIGGDAEMRLRFEALVEDNCKNGFARSVFPVLCGLLLITSYFLIIQPARYPNQDDAPDLDAGYYVTYSNANLEPPDDMYLRLIDDQYYLYVNGENLGMVLEDTLSDPPLNNLLIIGGK